MFVLCLPVWAMGQTAGKNAIATDILQVPTTSLSTIDQMPIGQRQFTVQYMDGLGRLLQQNVVRGSAEGSDIISFHAYDQYGREGKQYLPYTRPNNNGAFVSNPLQGQGLFYNAKPGVAHTTVPFSETVFDGSPLSRPVESGAPGEAFQIGTGHTKELRYLTNAGTLPVRRWERNGGQCISPGVYPPGELMGEHLRDEDEGESYEFKDKLGRVVCKRSLAVDNAGNRAINGGLADWNDTYYVYDAFGQVAFVIPPNAVGLMRSTNNWDIASLGADLVFRYTYDGRGRQVERKVPGMGWQYTVYDNLDRPILSQDANLRSQNRWKFVQYDVLGRPVVEGVFENGSQTNRTAMQTYVDQLLGQGNVKNHVQPAAGNTGNGFGYSADAFPAPLHATGFYQIRMLNWYDDYDFDGDGVADVAWTADPDSEFPNKSFDRLKGKVTGTKVRILNNSDVSAPVDWIESALFYDKDGNIVHTRSNNHFGSFDLYWAAFDFTGKLLRSRSIHQLNAPSQVSIREWMTYDAAGRPIRHIHQINGQDPVVSSENSYNELGQLIEKNIHAREAGGVPLQSVDYQYHIRGWLREVNDVDGAGSGQEILLLARTGANVEEVPDSNGGSHLELDVTVKSLDVEATMHALIPIFKNDTNTYVLQADSGEAVWQELKAIEGQELETYYNFLPVDSAGLAEADTLTKLAFESQLGQLGVTDSAAGETVTGAARQAVQGQLGDPDARDLFAYRLFYEEGFGDLQANPLYSGNISAMVWKSASDGKVRAYGYEYDALKRLRAAHYGSLDPITAAFSGDLGQFSVPSISYDPNGNITSLDRNGLLASGGFGQMDQLQYSYNGNQLEAVTDYAVSAGVGDFQDQGATGPLDYSYNANGNLVSDANKGFSVTYNENNLPLVVDFGQGRRIAWLYDASGRKLRKRVTDGTQQPLEINQRDYAGGFVYQDGALEFFAVPEGRAVPDGTAFRYEYIYTDHLGNTRLRYSDLNGDGVAEAQGEVLQDAHCYPYGLPMQGIGAPVAGVEELRLFGGKEVQRDFGLDWADFGARFYDAALGRWFSVDPKVAEMPNWSPYNHAFNNPLIFIDPDGQKPIPVTSRQFRLYANSVGKYGNQQIGSYFERLSIASLQTTRPVLHNTTQDFFSPARQRMNGGLPASVRPDGISAYLGASSRGETFISPSFYEAKATSATLTKRYRKGQITGMIDALANMDRRPNEMASLTLVTTADTKISADILEYATSRRVVVFQSVAALDDETREFILSEKTLMNGNGISTLIDQLRKLNGSYDEFNGVNPLNYLNGNNPGPGDPDPATIEDR